MLAEDSIAIPVESIYTDTLQADMLQIDTLEADTIPPVVLITDSMPNVVVYQDSTIAQLLYYKSAGFMHEKEVSGYRVQIFSSNRQQIAKNEAILLEKEIAPQVDVAIYVTYTPPFWKVRLGDFLTYEEASEFKRIFIQDHPSLIGDTYVVRDQIKVRQ